MIRCATTIGSLRSCASLHPPSRRTQIPECLDRLLARTWPLVMPVLRQTRPSISPSRCPSYCHELTTNASRPVRLHRWNERYLMHPTDWVVTGTCSRGSSERSWAHNGQMIQWLLVVLRNVSQYRAEHFPGTDSDRSTRS